MGDPKSTGRKAKTSPSRRSRRSKSTSRRVLFAQSTKRFRTTLSSISSILPLFLRILKLKWRKIFVHSLRLTSKLATTSGRASFHVRFSTSLVKLLDDEYDEEEEEEGEEEDEEGEEEE